MKTFEERYTAWIDGQLEGSTLAAFEQELERRAAAGEARAERTETQRLRDLMRKHLEAPVLNNAEFFSHQLRERINTERTTGTRRAPSPAKGGIFSTLFPWSVTRLAWTGAACLFVAGALYYGLEPGPGSNGPVAVAQRTPAKPQTVQPEQQVVADNPTTPAVPRNPSDRMEMVKASPTPVPFDDSPDIKVNPASPASGTPLLYSKPNVNVLWTNGLDYLPDVPTPAALPANAPAPAPNASVAP